jgi:hypothetical protein
VVQLKRSALDSERQWAIVPLNNLPWWWLVKADEVRGSLG